MVEEYTEFRKRYARMLRGVKRELENPLHRQMFEAVASTAFGAGFKAGKEAKNKELRLRPWKP